MLSKVLVSLLSFAATGLVTLNLTLIHLFSSTGKVCVVLIPTHGYAYKLILHQVSMQRLRTADSY